MTGKRPNTRSRKSQSQKSEKDLKSEKDPQFGKDRLPYIHNTDSGEENESDEKLLVRKPKSSDVDCTSNTKYDEAETSETRFDNIVISSSDSSNDLDISSETIQKNDVDCISNTKYDEAVTSETILENIVISSSDSSDDLDISSETIQKKMKIYEAKLRRRLKIKSQKRLTIDNSSSTKLSSKDEQALPQPYRKGQLSVMSSKGKQWCSPKKSESPHFDNDISSDSDEEPPIKKSSKGKQNHSSKNKEEMGHCSKDHFEPSEEILSKSKMSPKTKICRRTVEDDNYISESVDNAKRLSDILPKSTSQPASKDKTSHILDKNNEGVSSSNNTEEPWNIEGLITKTQSIDDNLNDVIKIANLDNNQTNNFQIIGKITSLTNLKSWTSATKSGKMMKFVVTDESGSIMVTAFNETAEDLIEIIKFNMVISLQNGSLKEAYNKDMHSFEITCTRNTSVKPIAKETVKVNDVVTTYNTFKEIKELEKDAIVNVKGIIRKVYNNVTVESRTHDRTFEKKVISIQDESGLCLDIVLWSTDVSLIDNSHNGKRMTLTKGKVSTFQGVNSVNVSSTSLIKFN